MMGISKLRLIQQVPKNGFSEWDADATPLDVGNSLIVRVAGD